MELTEEELMYAMKYQIKCCDEPVEPLLRQFFKQELVVNTFSSCVFDNTSFVIYLIHLHNFHWHARIVSKSLDFTVCTFYHS